MIVKDESHIIINTLTNLTKYINFSYWVICDTGSSDNTKELITDFFKKANIPGELIKTPWKDFGTNRTLALMHAYNKSDYAFVFDADDEIKGNFVLPEKLDKDWYNLQYGDECGIRLMRPQLFNNRKKWQYLGVVHEFLEAIDPVSEATHITGDYYFTLGESGNRSKDTEKYTKDAALLEAAFNNTADKKMGRLHSRYAYYCAQSYWCCNNIPKAIEFYKKTIKLFGWLEEKYVSSFRIYDLSEIKEDALQYLIDAKSYSPKRLECYHRLINYHLLNDNYAKSLEYYKEIQNYYENDFYKNNIVGKYLSINITDYTFYLPYIMIIVSERTKNYNIGIRMYEIIFKYKLVIVEQFYITHLFSNLKFFYDKVNDPNFFIDMRKYIGLLREKGLTIENSVIVPYLFNQTIDENSQEEGNKPILLICGCEKYKQSLISAIERNKNSNYKIIGVIAKQGSNPSFDGSIVTVDAEDTYVGLPMKIKAAFTWIYNNFPNIPGIFKTDDDIYFTDINNLALEINRNINIDYWGIKVDFCSGGPVSSSRIDRFENKNVSNENKNANYCYGLGYWVSKKSIPLIVNSNLHTYGLEDVLMGHVLNNGGIYPKEYYIDFCEKSRNTLLYVFLSCQKNITTCNERIINMMKHISDDFLIVLGGYSTTTYDQTTHILQLNCNDLYEGLPEKAKKTYKFISENNIFDKYSHVCKLDDDMVIKKLFSNDVLSDYCGKVNNDTGNRSWHIGKCSKNSKYYDKEYRGDYVPWCLGGHGYIISRKCLKIIAKRIDHDYDVFCYEDLFIAIILYENNVFPKTINNLEDYICSPVH